MIKEISDSLAKGNYNIPDGKDKGEELEFLLTEVCTILGEVGSLTKQKADVDFILGIVGSYMISQKEGTLLADTKPPSFLFNDILFPAIEDSVIDVEVIEDAGE